MKQFEFYALLLAFSCSFSPLIGQIPDTVGLFKDMEKLTVLCNKAQTAEETETAKKSILRLENILIPSFKNSDLNARLNLNKAILNINIKNYEEALSAALESHQLYKNIGSECDAMMIDIEFELGRAYYFNKKYEDLEQTLLHALACNRAINGENHVSSAKILNVIAIGYYSTRNLEKAEKYFLATAKIAKEQISVEDKLYIGPTIDLGNIQYYKGDFENSLAYFEEVLGILEKAGKTESKKYLNTLRSASVVNGRLGKYKEEERILLKLKKYWESKNETESIEYAKVLDGLASVYSATFNLEKSIQYYEKALQIFKITESPSSTTYLGCIIDLAYTLSDNKDYAKAEKLLLEAINTFEKQDENSTHEFYKIALQNLAIVYIESAPSKAEKQLNKAYALAKARGLNDWENLGMTSLYSALYIELGELEKADSLLLLSEKNWETNPTFARAVNSSFLRVQVKLALSDMEGASEYLSKWSSIDQVFLKENSTYLSEQELTTFLVDRTVSLNKILVESENKRSEIPEFNKVFYNELLSLKSYGLFSASTLKHRALSNPKHASKYKNLLAAQQQLSGYYRTPDDFKKEIDSLENECELLEKELARTIRGFELTENNIVWKNIQSTLKTGEAAIEFYQYFKADEFQGGDFQYFALLLRRGEAAPIFVPLFKQKEIEALLQQYADRRGGYANSLYSNKGGKGLYDLIWKPIEAHLEDAKTIFYAPSGLLHQINFNALATGSKSTISNNFKLIRLNSTREIAFKQPKIVSNATATLFGGIRYEMDSMEISMANSSFRGGYEKVALNFQDVDSTLRSGGEEWGFLPYSQKELDAIKSSLESAKITVKSISGFEATEEAFKAMDSNSPQILHIATHAYFFPDPKQSNTNISNEVAYKSSEHPLIRSGLIMSGANHAWNTGKPLKPDMEDGILTSYEISQLDLTQTELVVLSACETGLGEIQNNEGVYGLQRAFKMAGVQHIIMSLWQVSDSHTQQLMEHFYKNYLQDGKDVHEALKIAQDEMRRQGLSPYYWAGFVVLD